MKPWIQNVSMADIKRGFHYDAGPNSMLIQIVDPAYEFPKPALKFKEVHQFEFLDSEEENDEFAIQPEQAEQIAELLQHALDNNMNVVVHCHAGVCRSGAVVSAGVQLGFRDTGDYRAPNLRVKKLLFLALGYDEMQAHMTT